MQRRYEFLIAFVLILIGTAMRFLPHPANVAPIAAIALFAGVYLPKRWSLLVPLIAMILSDWVIGFHNTIAFTWGSMMLISVLGWMVAKRTNVFTVIAGSLSGSVLFYLITNWAVWQYTHLYPHTLAGLQACYVAAIPFFRNTVLGDLFYAGAFFGAYAVARYAVQRLIFTKEIDPLRSVQ